MFKVTALTEKCLLRRGDSFHLPIQCFASDPKRLRGIWKVALGGTKNWKPELVRV